MNKNKISKMTYEQLLRVWRFTLVGKVPFDTIEKGVYFRKIMEEKKNALPSEDAVSISKRVGWEKL